MSGSSKTKKVADDNLVSESNAMLAEAQKFGIDAVAAHVESQLEMVREQIAKNEEQLESLRALLERLNGADSAVKMIASAIENKLTELRGERS